MKRNLYLIDTKDIPDLDNTTIKRMVMEDIEMFFKGIYYQDISRWNHNAWPHIGIGKSGSLVGHAGDFSKTDITKITFKEMQWLARDDSVENENLKKTFNATEEFKEELL